MVPAPEKELQLPPPFPLSLPPVLPFPASPAVMPFPVSPTALSPLPPLPGNASIDSMSGAAATPSDGLAVPAPVGDVLGEDVADGVAVPADGEMEVLDIADALRRDADVAGFVAAAAGRDVAGAWAGRLTAGACTFAGRAAVGGGATAPGRGVGARVNV